MTITRLLLTLWLSLWPSHVAPPWLGQYVAMPFTAVVAAATPTLNQSGTTSCYGAGTSTVAVTCSFGTALTAGHMLLVCAGADNPGANGAVIATPTMTGETLTQITNASNTGNANGALKCYSSNSVVGGQTQVSEKPTASSDIHIQMFDIANPGSSPVDASGNTNSSATTSSVSTSTMTSNATDLVIAIFFDNANNRTFTHGTGYTAVVSTNNSSGGDSSFSEDNTTSTTGTQTATATGGAGDLVVMAIVAIK
jgi:hypothetical protein